MSAEEATELKAGFLLAVYEGPVSASLVAQRLSVPPWAGKRALAALERRGFAARERRLWGRKRVYWTGKSFGELYASLNPGRECPASFAALGAV